MDPLAEVNFDDRLATEPLIDVDEQCDVDRVPVVETRRPSFDRSKTGRTCGLESFAVQRVGTGRPQRAVGASVEKYAGFVSIHS